EKFGVKFFEMVGHYMLGWVASRDGDFDVARTEYLKELSMADELGDRNGVAQALNGLADLAIEREEWPRALRLGGAAQAIRDKLGGGWPPEAMRAREPLAPGKDALGVEAAEAHWAQGLATVYDGALVLAREGDPG